MHHDINDHSVYVHIAGAFHEYPATRETCDLVLAEVEKRILNIVIDGGTFQHKDPQNGVISMIRVPAGMPVQIVPGAVVRRLQNEARQMQMMQAQPRIIRQ